MRILYIADELTQSGAIKSFEEMVMMMQSNHHVECTVVTSRISDISKHLNEEGITTIVANYGSYMQNRPVTWWKVPLKYVLSGFRYWTNGKKAIETILSQVDMSTFDIIHTNINRVDIGIELSIRSGVPNVMHIREFGDLDFKCWSYRRKYIQYLNKNVTKFIAISNAVKTSWVARGIAQDKMTVIYNGVDNDKIVSKKPTVTSDESMLKLVIVGGVIPAKGQLQAIKALALLPSHIRDHISLDIIGWSSTEYYAIVAKEIKKYNMGNHVNVLGARNDVFDLLKNYDVGLMCSRAEGFGRVTAEYMHAGLGVIASNSGANPEIIDNEQTGLLYEYEDTEKLAACINQYYTDRRLLYRCAIEGQKVAQKKYTARVNAQNIEALYESML